MQAIKPLISAILILVLAHSAVLGQKNDSLPQKKLKIVPLPALFYTPETRLGFGGLVNGVFNLGNKETTRNSNAQVLAAYTLNKQTIIETKHILFLPEEKYVVSGRLNFYDFPIFYYGIGNDTDKDNEENLEYKVVEFEQRVLKQVRKHLFFGPQYRFTRLYDLVFEPEFLMDDLSILQSQTGSNGGLGFSVVYDSRDNVLNCFSGSFFQLSTFFHGSSLGGEHQFNRYTLDTRQFFRLPNRDIIAFQYFGEFNTGNTPFREMALLGGDAVMRGYYKGRFRDHQQMALQAEYRKQIIPWFGFTLFSAIGEVAPELRSFELPEFKYTVGGGLRFMVNKADRLNIRIDYGLGKETSGFYFAVAEAF